MTKLPIPSGWNKRVQSAILQAISLGRHCFVSIVARTANSPKAADRVVAQNERLKHEVESLREELRLKDVRMARVPSQRRPYYSELCVRTFCTFVREFSPKHRRSALLVTTSGAGC